MKEIIMKRSLLRELKNTLERLKKDFLILERKWRRRNRIKIEKIVSVREEIAKNILFPFCKTQEQEIIQESKNGQLETSMHICESSVPHNTLPVNNFV